MRQPPLAPEAFLLPEGVLYLDGNSLGPLTRRGEAYLMAALADWRRLAVAAWTEASPPWLTWAEALAATEARLLLGAAPDEVAITGQTTVNLHQLLHSFYRPAGRRRQIVIDALAFPSDRYAVASVARRLGSGEEDVRLVPSRDGRTLDPADLEAALDDRVCVAVLPSVLFGSGQLLDVAALTARAHDAGALVLWDLSHSVGILPHALDAWGVDLAVWCNYKYLSGGPGAVGGLFVARRHLAAEPALAGWWGSAKERQFAMPQRLEPAPGAGRFAVGTPPILALAPLAGSLELYETCPLDEVRAASLTLTGELLRLADTHLAPVGWTAVTPRAPQQRGGHVALVHPEAARLGRALRRRGVVPDFRPPDMLRLSPNPLYASVDDLDRAVAVLSALTEAPPDPEEARPPLVT
jgi:kynureninase